MPKQDASSNFGSVGLKEEPKLIGTVVVYERKTGRIAHTHQFVHFGYGEPPSKASMEQTALKGGRFSRWRSRRAALSRRAPEGPCLLSR